MNNNQLFNAIMDDENFQKYWRMEKALGSQDGL